MHQGSWPCCCHDAQDGPLGAIRPLHHHRVADNIKEPCKSSSRQPEKGTAHRQITHCAGLLPTKALPPGGVVAPFDPAVCSPRAPQAALKLLLGRCAFIIRLAASLPAPCTLCRLASTLRGSAGQPVIALLLVLVVLTFRRRHCSTRDPGSSGSLLMALPFFLTSACWLMAEHTLPQQLGQLRRPVTRPRPCRRYNACSSWASSGSERQQCPGKWLSPAASTVGVC